MLKADRDVIGLQSSSVQYVIATLGDAILRGCGVKLSDLGFEMLVDKQECLQRTAQVAIATCHDLVDGSFVRSESHRSLLLSLRTIFDVSSPFL
jgi:hypothetical protein